MNLIVDTRYYMIVLMNVKYFVSELNSLQGRCVGKMGFISFDDNIS